ncbi:MAG TPA: c-type cytochrome biogenesis protein CcmI [Rhodospirillales bacterium]|nr:c-type cytochrome biogenesis protein CcmI [Rhodospirillales bacterium]
MIALWILIALITVVALALLLFPLFRRPAAESGGTDFDVSLYREQLKEVELDLGRGLLSDAEAAAAKMEIQRRTLAASETAGAKPSKATPPPAAAGRGVSVFIAITLPVGAVALYLQLGQPRIPDFPFAARKAPAAAGQERGDMEELAGRLAERLARDPDDVKGWLLLARTYKTVENYQGAAEAYRRALQIDNRPGISVDHAEVLMLLAGGAITTEGREIFQRVRATDPFNPKARYYLGIDKARQGDARGALQDWVDLVAVSDDQAPWLDLVRAQIMRTAEEAGLDPAAIKPTAQALELAESQAKSLTPPPTADRQQIEAIRAMVEKLAAKLAKRPDDMEGWSRLARAYEVLGETEKAAVARNQARAKK